jgi:uncharacterized membrane protein YhaH (DUF805 family)
MPPADVNQLLAFFFRPQGRIGRLEYFLGAAFIYAVNLALLSFMLHKQELDMGAFTLLWLIAAPSLVGVFVVMAKRCHDIGLPGSFVLLAVIPGAGLLWEIALALVPGNVGPNRYGAAPRFQPD